MIVIVVWTHLENHFAVFLQNVYFSILQVEESPEFSAHPSPTSKLTKRNLWVLRGAQIKVGVYLRINTEPLFLSVCTHRSDG